MERDGAYLLDMLLAARDAVEFAGRVTYSQFENSRLHQNAILKAVEIVGEAASHVSSSMRESQPDIPWREIVGMRNRLVRVYFDVDIGWSGGLCKKTCRRLSHNSNVSCRPIPPMTSNHIAAIASTGESGTPEFKATSGTRREAAMTVCALLNQRCGQALFGVMQDGKKVRR